MLQGDIRAKQHRLSGHQYVSTIDFTSGFYAVEIDQESRPYTAFYIEGLGHFWYTRMPFGLTGVPTAFAAMGANHLHDLIADETLEIFVDDGGMAADTFEGMKGKLIKIMDRVREQKLSLSAAKSKLFMSEVTFAGARIGPKGVLPDLTKLTAIVDWKKPSNALNLVSFLCYGMQDTLDLMLP
jgi:Reverse transcriptase (RNA-dependent DNA polymerase)